MRNFCRQFAGCAGVLCLILQGCTQRDPSVSATEAKITGSAGDPPVELRAQWQANHLYDVSLQFGQSTQVRNRNTDDDFDQDITFRLDFNGGVKPEVSRPANSNLWLNLEVTGVMFGLIRGEVPLIYYDTRSQVGRLEDDQRTTEALEKLVGSRWNYSVDREGAVLSARTETNSPGLRALNSDAKVMGLSLVRRLFSPQYFRPFLEFSSLPQEPVKIGESWPVERYFNAGTVGTVLFKGRCTFKGWQMNSGRRCARLDVAGDLKTSNRLPGKLGKMIKGSSELEKGTLKGQIWYDPEQKLPVQSITELNMMTVVTSRSKVPRGAGGTNVVAGVTNGPVITRLSVPLSQRIKLKITDLGAQLPALKPSATP